MRLSARWTLAPFAFVAALLLADPTLSGAYSRTVDVADQSLVGKGAMTPGDSGRFTGKFEFPEPFELPAAWRLSR